MKDAPPRIFERKAPTHAVCPWCHWRLVGLPLSPVGGNAVIEAKCMRDQCRKVFAVLARTDRNEDGKLVVRHIMTRKLYQRTSEAWSEALHSFGVLNSDEIEAMVEIHRLTREAA